MISVGKHFLFVHVPKTGGNSIQERLKAYSEDEIVSVAPHQDGIERFEVRNPTYPTVKHSTLAEYQRILEPDLYARLFKFATIRDPWDKLISWYFSPHRGTTTWDREAFKKLVMEVQPLRYYVVRDSRKERLGRGLGRWRPAALSSALDADVDLIMRFEHLDADFRDACRRIGIPYSPLAQRNRSDRADYRAYYDEELVEIVAKRFREEIEYGGYRYEPLAS